MKKLIGLISFIAIAAFSFSPVVFAGVNEGTMTPTASGAQYIGPNNAVDFIFLAPIAGSITAYKNVSISTATLLAAPTAFTDIVAAGSYARNIQAQIVFSSNNALCAYVGTLTLTGTNIAGVTVSEVLALSTTAVVSSQAYTGNVNAVVNTTSMTMYTYSNNTAASIQIGSGNTFGIPSLLVNTSDVCVAMENGVVNTAPTVSTTYNTVTPGTLPNGTLNFAYRVKLKAF